MHSVRPFCCKVRAVVAGAGVALAVAACGGTAPAPDAARPVLVVRPGAAHAGAASLAGEVRAREEATLSFRIGGKLVERRVDVGERVQRGQVLAVLDPGDLHAQSRAARAELAAAEAELGRARADRARYATLAGDRLVSRSALDAQDAAAAAAQGRVDAARAQVQLTANQVAYSELRAPEDGVVSARFAEAGQVVAAGGPVYAIAADGAREVAFAVAEGQVDDVRPGRAVQVELWSQPGQAWPGAVREVAPAADPATRTYAVRAAVQAPPDTLQLGQSARVRLGAGASGLSVPLSALQETAGGPAVFVVDPATSTLKLQPVTTGAWGSDWVPVQAGLAPDDWVVAAGGHLLQPGTRVVPVGRDNRPVLPPPPPAEAAASGDH